MFLGEDSKSADQGDDNDEDVTDMDADDEMKEEDLSKVVIDVAEKSDVETEDVAERNSTSGMCNRKKIAEKFQKIFQKMFKNEEF